MQHKKGQFISSKVSSDEGSASSVWNATQGSGQDEITQDALCTHCGMSSKSTPMMLHGPAGPRTLCNACGLKWANKPQRRGAANELVQEQALGNKYTSKGNRFQLYFGSNGYMLFFDKISVHDLY